MGVHARLLLLRKQLGVLIMLFLHPAESGAGVLDALSAGGMRTARPLELLSQRLRYVSCCCAEVGAVD